MPNYLSTYQLHQSYHSLFGEYDGAGGVEMREIERLKMGCIMTPMPNYLSTCLSLFYYSSFDEWGRCGDEKDG